MWSLFADLQDIPIAFNIITWKITNDVKSSLQDSRWYDALVGCSGLKKLANDVQKVGHPCCRGSRLLEYSQSTDFFIT